MSRAFADYLDGGSARVQRVAVWLESGGVAVFRIALADGETILNWPLGAVRQVPDQADRGSVVLALDGGNPARVILRDADLGSRLVELCPDLQRTRWDGGVLRRLAAWATAAIASVALIVFVLVPVMANQLAMLLPEEGERALGDSTLEQIRTALVGSENLKLPICEEAHGLRALEKMAARLHPGAALPYNLRLHVLNHEMVNAFALPGGHIVLFRGLLQGAESAEEVAAVLAHEMGHVVNRDPTRLALRSAGSVGVLGLLLGDFAGGAAVLYLTEMLIQARYSRGAEAAADVYAHEMLARAGLPTRGMADFFLRLEKEHGREKGLVSHLASHPDLTRRAEAAIAADKTGGGYTPVLSETEWQALRNICRQGNNHGSEIAPPANKS